ANLTIDKVGTGYTLTATSGTLTQATSNAFNITAAPPPTGDLTVTTTTSGSNAPSSYTVTVDGGQSKTIQATGSVSYRSRRAASHSVQLNVTPDNCCVSEANPQTVRLPADGTAQASFTISCTALTGDLTVTTTTSGSNAPSSYTVTVDGGQSKTIQATGSVSY